VSAAERNSRLGRDLAAELQLKQTAIETIAAITGCARETAMNTLDRHLLTTTTMQQAVTACCTELHPAARPQTFLEQNLGEGVRPLNTNEMVRHLAQVQRQENEAAAVRTPVSDLQPVNLDQCFLHSATQQLQNHELQNLPTAKRLAVAHHRAAKEQWEAALDQQTWKRDFHTPDAHTAQPTKPSPYTHSSPAVRMAAARELFQEQHQNFQSPAVVVVGGGTTKLPIWQPGEESQQRGFYWSTKQHIQHAWRQYMIADGQYAPRTFKSLISQQLVPTICAECDIPLSDWDHISDRILLERIEARLKPKSTTDVINRLRELSISQDTSKGTLSQRYRVFAEAYLQRIAEAQECGCKLSDNAIKQSFTRAVRQEPALETWVSEEKWTSVWDAHRRIVERLRDYDAWSVYDSMQRNVTTQQQHVHTPPLTMQQPHGPTAKPEVGQKRQWDGSKQHQSFVNTLAELMKDASAVAMNECSGGGGGGGQRTGPPVHQGDKPYHHPGLDARGVNWHFPSEHIKCREQPCTGLFCQICGFHGHTAAKCLKRLKQIPGLNFQGYYQETKPNSPPVRYESAAGGGGGTTHSPQSYTHQTPSRTTVPRPQPAAPAQIQRDQRPPTPQQQRQQQPVFPHFVNNTAPRTARVHPDREERISRANQTSDGSSGGPTHEANSSSQHDDQ
jgi:hypothetical protein